MVGRIVNAFVWSISRLHERSALIDDLSRLHLHWLLDLSWLHHDRLLHLTRLHLAGLHLAGLGHLNWLCSVSSRLCHLTGLHVLGGVWVDRLLSRSSSCNILWLWLCWHIRRNGLTVRSHLHLSRSSLIDNLARLLASCDKGSLTLLLGLLGALELATAIDGAHDADNCDDDASDDQDWDQDVHEDDESD